MRTRQTATDLKEVCLLQEKITLNKAIREAITLALIRLMDKKDFSQITISELIRVAGVSRSSFYRNFTSKEQVLICHIHNLYEDFFHAQNIPSSLLSISDVQDFLLPRFALIRENRDFFTVLSKNHLLYYIFEQMKSEFILLLSGQGREVSSYFLAAISGACAGVVQKWVENDFQESIEELVRVFAAEPLYLTMTINE